MASSNSSNDDHIGDTKIDLAQAFLDLARGEKTAQQLESNLSSLERKLDDLLNSFENSEAVKKLDEGNGGGSSSSSSGKVNETKGTDESEEKEGNA